MKKITTVLLAMLLLPDFIWSQPNNNDENIIKLVAGNILKNTTYDFVDRSNGAVFDKVDENNYTRTVQIRSRYNTWNYWNGVLNIAMLDLASYFDNPAYKQFAVKNYEFAFDNVPIFREKYKPVMDKWSYPFGQLIVMQELDDCGAMGGALIEVYKDVKRDDYKAYIDKAAGHILHKQGRLADGTLARAFPHRMTIWGDDLYMSIAFLARMGNLTGEQKYFDDAAKQVVNFTKYLYDPVTQLYYHGWYDDLKVNNVAHWGRCNGWVMLAQTDLLEYLPKDYPLRDTLISILQQQIIGVSRYQSQSGLWRQLLDKTDSYPETSCSAMFTYAIARAVNNGWIDKRYRTIAEEGWKGLKTKIRPDGQVEDICIGTGMEDNLVFYYNRPTQLNDIHGLGPVLMAGVEILKLRKLN